MKKILLLSIIALFASGCSIPYLTDGNENAALESVTFAVIGDNEGVNSVYESLMERIAQDDSIDFVLHVGDIVEHGGAEELLEVKTYLEGLNMAAPFYAIPGNHDIIDDPERTAFASAFGETPRSIDVDELHLVLLDNADRKVGFSDETLAWLEQDLQRAVGKTIVIAFHRPFGYPLADTLGDDETSASDASNELFTDIIAKHNIAYMFCGHIHTNLEFSFVTARDKKDNATKSVPVVISGGGGQPPQELFSSLFSEDYHYLKVTVGNGDVSIDKISL